MKLEATPQPTGKLALRSGLTFGIALGIVHSVLSILITQINLNVKNTSTGGNSFSTFTIILSLILPLIWIIGFLVAGAWASKGSGKLSAGVLAGLFAGTFGGIIAGFGQAIAITISSGQSVYSSGSADLLLFSGYATVFYVMVLALGAGAGFGVLGGLIGQSMSNVRPLPAPRPVYGQPVAYIPVPPQQAPLPPQQRPEQPHMEQWPEQ